MSLFLNNRHSKKFWMTMQIKIERKLATKCNFKLSSCTPLQALRVTLRHSGENTQGVLSSTVQQHSQHCASASSTALHLHQKRSPACGVRLLAALGLVEAVQLTLSAGVTQTQTEAVALCETLNSTCGLGRDEHPECLVMEVSDKLYLQSQFKVFKIEISSA